MGGVKHCALEIVVPSAFSDGPDLAVSVCVLVCVFVCVCVCVCVVAEPLNTTRKMDGRSLFTPA